MSKTAPSESEAVEQLAWINAELSRAEALVAKGNGWLARKVLTAAIAALDGIHGDEPGLRAELDQALAIAQALPTITRPTFPNPAHATPSED